MATLSERRNAALKKLGTSKVVSTTSLSERRNAALKKIGIENDIKASGKFFSGGFVRDVIDVANIASYGVGGLLSGKGIASGVANRISPSVALGVKNPVAAFATDVALDPLTYLSGGLTKFGSTALKTGKFVEEGGMLLKNTEGLASTFAKQAQLGQRAAVSLDVPFIKSLQGIPLIKGEKLFEGITRTGEVLKSTPYVGTALEALGARKYLGIGARASVDALEAKASVFDVATEVERRAKVVNRLFVEDSVPKLKGFYKEIKKLKNAGITDDDLKLLTEKAYKPAVKIKPELEDLFTRIKTFSDDLGVTRFKLLQSIGGKAYAESKTLTDKIFPNVLQASIDGDIPRAVGNAKQFGLSKSEMAAEYAGFKNISNGKVVGGRGGKEIDLVDGSKLFEVDKGVYATKEVRNSLIERKQIENAIEENSARAKKAVVKQQREAYEAVTAALRNDLNRLPTIQEVRASSPDKLFTRVAVSPASATEIAGKFGSRAKFSEDALALSAIKTERVGRLAALDSYIQGIKGLGSKLSKNAQVPDGYARSSIEGLENYIFPEDLAPFMDKVHKSFSNIDSVNEFLHAYDKLQNTWKGLSTYVNLAFHTRNGLSNMWQIFLADGLDPKAFGIAASIQAKLNKALVVDKIKGVSRHPSEILKGDELNWYNEFITMGLGSVGSFTADMGTAIARWNKNPVFATGEAVGHAIEDGSKLSLYIQRRLNGFNPQSAASEVRKYLFDYADITDIERSLLKRVFPFYTWSRKNIPLQVAMLLDKPAKFGAIGKLTDAIEANVNGEPMPENLLPGWLKEAYPVFIGKSPDSMYRYIKLEGFLPAIDLNNLTDKGFILDSVSPLIKTIPELIMNYDTFTERQIQEFEGQKRRILGMSIDTRVAKVLSLIRPLNELDKLLGTNDVTKVPDVRTRVMNLLIGKMYNLDIRSQRATFKYLQGREKSAVEKAMNRARKQNDTDEIKRLRDRLRQIKRGEGIML